MLAIDHTSVRYGRVVGVGPTNERHSGQVVWQWLCDCGELFLASPSDFVRGKRLSCRICSKENKIRSATKHGMNGSYEHRCWMNIKHRCYNKKSKSYEYYGGRGIEMYAPWKKDFLVFIADVGLVPDNTQEWSLDRIDVNGNYEPGNVRWATKEQQAQNHRKRKDNTSGVTGVMEVKNTDYPGFVAAWFEASKSRSKFFGIRKYGRDEAFRLACEYRAKMVEKLNSEGANYTPWHGQ